MAGIVDEHIETPETVQCRQCRGAHRLIVRDVAALPFDTLGHARGRSRQVQDQETGSGLDHTPRCRQAYAR